MELKLLPLIVSVAPGVKVVPDMLKMEGVCTALTDTAVKLKLPTVVALEA